MVLCHTFSSSPAAKPSEWLTMRAHIHGRVYKSAQCSRAGELLIFANFQSVKQGVTSISGLVRTPRTNKSWILLPSQRHHLC
jgi:hypothetical protein